MRVAATLLMAGASLLTAAPLLQQSGFGKTPEGVAVSIFTLTNKNGLETRITTYGGIVVSLKTPDRSGALADIVLGFDSLDGYLAAPNPFFGALVGRYANRIAHARFALNGVEYKLEKNNGENSLHGGSRGFDKRVWTARELPDGGLELTYLSKDGEEGFPGSLMVRATYHLTDANELRIDYAATTDKPTVVNLTNHSYFNLKGQGSGDVLSHVVTFNADRFTPVDAGLIPTGEVRPVAGTPFDFRKPASIGSRIDQNDEQLKLGRGYDHNFVINRAAGSGPILAARVEEPSSGRVLEVLTTEPGVQFYTANGLGNLHGKSGAVYGRRAGFCLETQHFPDSPNQLKFPSTELQPSRKFQSTTVFRFLTRP